MIGNYDSSDSDDDSDSDSEGKKRRSRARRHSDDGGGGGNLLGAAIFGEEYAKSHQARANHKVRPYKEPSVSKEMLERAREYRENQMAASRINRFAPNAGGQAWP